jgi:MFS family permease
VRAARGAVGALFFANGALFANVVPRYPDLKEKLDLTNATLGTAVAGYGLGALILGLLGGVVVNRWGSRRVAPLSTIGIAANLVLLGAAPSWAAFAAALCVAGAMDSIADIGVNAQALQVERRYGRSILNSLHGVWSIGAVVGGAMGAVAAGLDVPVALHLGLAGGLFAALAVVVARYLLSDQAQRRVHAPARPRLGPSLLALGVIAAMAQTIEDTAATWSAVYLREDLGAAAAVAGLGFIALQSAQTVGRFLGDRAVTRFGDRAVARAGAALAGAATTSALALPSVPGTVLAFGAAGLGIGTLIPASLRTADGLPGLPRGAGLTLVGTVVRLSILVSPPLVGFVADAASLRAALLVMPLAAVVVLALARTLPRQ